MALARGASRAKAGARCHQQADSHLRRIAAEPWYIGVAMTDRTADRTRAVCMPLFAALMLWNTVTADTRWCGGSQAVRLFFSGAGGWFVRKLWESKPLAVLVVVSATVLGCGGEGSPTGPSGGSGVRVILSVPSFGVTISLSVDGQTISAAATQEIRLSAGTHTINGSFTPTGPVTLPQLVITFIGHPAGGGGVRSGSLRSLTGPVLQTNHCSITYSTTEPQSFSVQFDVTTDTNSSCPAPGSF
jgi:hypothetical protein